MSASGQRFPAWQNLQAELLGRVVGFLGIQYLLRVERCCRAWNRLLKHPEAGVWAAHNARPFGVLWQRSSLAAAS
ncbi:hypothetical protein WJX73_006823 [Symbiochloris irregularis]|uniref:F-box domain-containing protein n=1 Tax=Symbiochloris irregularis TaxID=706552 RepID=A0AAW1P5C9_9CHLO